ncbi:MAG: class I SAM-dependent methyltransferase [Ruminococcus sp.]|nr:class I SAM-dependent methyltransferase [Ruminococcus sp.]
MSYSSFAYFYDRLQSDVDYNAIAAFIDKQVVRFGGRKGILLDLACGTGSLCEELARLGYDVIGTDASSEMLSAALDKKYESGLEIQYLSQSMTELDMFGTVDVTVCTLDSINHLDSKEDIQKAFDRVSLFAFPDGMFIFDVNTPYKHKNVLADNTFVFELDGLYCVWQNEYDDTDGSVGITLDFFEQRDDGSYQRYTESFREIAPDRAEICSMLDDAGFEILDSFDDYTENKDSETSSRIVFVCRKVK